MSGPMSLEPGGPEQDTLAIRLATPRPRRPFGTGGTGGTGGAGNTSDSPTLAIRIPRKGPDEEAVSELAAELADRIGPAVHPYEVAALLEADGLSASLIKEKYGHPTLFSLAAALYERVPRTFPEPPQAPDPWRPDTLRCLLRGALFALPALAYLLTSPLWDVTRHAPVLIVAGTVSWAWGQALGHRAHVRLVTGRREAGRTLAGGSALGATVATALAAIPAGGGPVTAVAAAQSLYLAAAGVLLVLGRERLLLLTLTPLTAGAAVLFWWEPGALIRLTLPLLAVLATLAAAARVLGGCLAEPAAPGPDPRPPLRSSLPYGLFGLAAAILTTLEGRHAPYAVIALTLSMGPAEWLLYRYRGWSVTALRATSSPTGFLLRSGGVLGLCLTVYLLLLLPPALLIGHGSGTAAAAVLGLAAVLWTALLLQAFGVAWPPALVCLTTAAVAAAVAWTTGPPGPAALLPAICAPAALSLVALTLALLGRPSPHA
ncbi:MULTISPECIES: hypothetical protein [unclassified Streptomyces]|uniref:hypothetical protein n=1 Tax=unclassified Streptomyces TaxID=2593676 RepID=UPI001660814A|nr:MULTISPECIES: hypothetical protein [unclassified Streptomyces]MBD0709641.1 hypothetical protein [Streptomyces sp. CBMA291]MBD0713974.1 hypothetical protein [Streptomyces sp. CBMA370]MBD0715235.1 hypothetical protein [Streptomyces sp. CBMA370]